MGVHIDDIGIQSLDVALTESTDLTKKVDVTPPVLESNGAFHTAEAYDETYDFNFKGKGDLPAACDDLGGDGTFTMGGIATGVTIVSGIKEGERNTEHNNWEVSGGNWPNAS